MTSTLGFRMGLPFRNYHICVAQSVRLRAPLASAVLAAFVFASPAANAGSAGGVLAATIGFSGEVNAAAAASILSSYRLSHGLPALSVDPALMQVARRQAAAMAASGRMSHTVGGDFRTRIHSSGFRSLVAAENIGTGYSTMTAALAGWQGSPEHNENILLEGATRMGIARAGSFWALVLAEPAGERKRILPQDTQARAIKHTKKPNPHR
jgi:uncharacterized protein YkwD